MPAMIVRDSATLNSPWIMAINLVGDQRVEMGIYETGAIWV
jgi:hypothetical protein